MVCSHLIHPYPSDEDVERLATTCNMTATQVNNWMGQARHLNRSLIRQAMESAQSQFMTPDLSAAAAVNAKLQPEAAEMLQRWLLQHPAPALPSPEELSNLAAETGLQPQEVNTWLAAARSGALARAAAAAGPAKGLSVAAPPVRMSASGLRVISRRDSDHWDEVCLPSCLCLRLCIVLTTRLVAAGSVRCGV